MAEQTRQHLKQEFSQGERPSGDDFADLMDSFLNKRDDGLEVRNAERDLVLPGGLALGDSQLNQAGSLRLNGGRAQFHDGNAWVDLGSGGGGAFEEVGQAGEVAYADGNVGIGASFSPANPPTHRLEVDLEENTGPEQQVRLGNGIVSNGPGSARNDAQFYHQGQDPSTQYALRQLNSGEVRLNAPQGQRIRILQNNSGTPRLAVTGDGNVVVRAANNVSGSNAPFQVNGDAFKNTGENWLTASDARLKEDVRDLEAGLEKLLQVRPVRFRYNGKAGTRAGHEGVGILGQEIEQVFPEMIRQVPATLGEDGEQTADLRIYDGSALTYVLVNAVKELAGKVERLEKAVAGREVHDDDD